jgi:hypothetical protein
MRDWLEWHSLAGGHFLRQRGHAGRVERHYDPQRCVDGKFFTMFFLMMYF